MGSDEYDLIVLGGGPGGYVAAIRAAQLGFRVACVEKEPTLGGTCLRVGCIPSKALLESSAQFWQAKVGLMQHGIRVPEVELDLGAMLARKESIVSSLARGTDGLLRKNGVHRYDGHGRIHGIGRIVVEREGEKPLEVAARHILIATGSKPSLLRGIEYDGDRIGTSAEALSYAHVPKRLVVIGAGYIGLELGSVWRRLGAKVIVLEFQDRILPGMDSEVAEEARNILEKQGLEFRLKHRVARAWCDQDECIVECEGESRIVCDRILVAIGRVPNVDGLGLEAVDIRLDEKGCIPVDQHFATSAKGVYAVGDVIGGPMLAHKAQEEGIACVEAIITGHGHVDYDAIPSVVYTQPEIASVGRTEEKLRAAGIDYKKGVFPFVANGRAHILGESEGRTKILADAKTDRILGVHLIGPCAGDLIAEAAVAMAFHASSEDLARCCHAHPTLAEALKEAALSVDRRAIHI